MRVIFFVTTVGESITLRTLDAIAKHTPFKPGICVWYDACGRGVDYKFYGEINKRTDDIIMSTKNKYLSGSWGFASLYLDYDYIVTVPADSPPLPGYWEKMMRPFRLGSIGVSGEAWNKELGDRIDYNGRHVDGIACWNKEALNDVGGFSPSFFGFAYMHNELQKRMYEKCWTFAAMNGLCEEGNLKHEGRDLNQDVQNMIHRDNLTWLVAEKGKFKSYNWWSKEIEKEPVCR